MTTRGILLALTALAGACAGPSPAGAPASLSERLADGGLRFALDGQSDQATVGVSMHDQGGWSPHTIAIDLVSGMASLSSKDGALTINHLELGIADVVVSPAAVPPNGLHLTGLAIHSDQAVAATAGACSTEGTRCDLEAALPLVLEWSLVDAHGGVVPLGAQRFSAATLYATIDQATTGEISLGLSIDQPGQMWSWADLFRIEDAQLAIQGGAGGSVE